MNVEVDCRLKPISIFNIVAYNVITKFLDILSLNIYSRGVHSTCPCTSRYHHGYWDCEVKELTQWLLTQHGYWSSDRKYL